MNINAIRILAADDNKKGDLFGRLMEALVFALGYDHARLNIHKSGREIDIQAVHRTESRRLIAECKATQDPPGGADVNKFIGVLDAERRRNRDIPTEGYFVSLSGLTQTAIEQEELLGGQRFVFLDGRGIVEQLVAGRILVPQARAMESAGRCAAACAPQVLPVDACTLLAHEIGWLWLVHFQTQKSLTHFALIHADGSFIAPALVGEIVAADKATGGNLYTLSYLEPPKASLTDEEKVTAARSAYLEYLKKECGEIQLDGLPADEEVGARRLRLESLFVPLHVSRCSPFPGESEDGEVGDATRAGGEAKPPHTHRERPEARLPVGRVLSRHNRITVLGLPGGGKSTLLKRIAIAYAFANRRSLVDDKLPPRAWLPLFLRCRQIDKTKSSIVDLLWSIGLRAELEPGLVEGFKELVSRGLRDGSVMLLIDGLDEISSERDRVAFVHDLRTFLAIYPNASVIVTSREAGFRVIGGMLSAQCAHFRLCDLDAEDIARLTMNWSKEVLGDSASARAEAKSLSATISKNDRLTRLAGNPLLLTTLLLVKRWVGGPFPTKRTILYEKAIEVLLMTWNVQGHEPLDLDETLPQLEYLAFVMLSEGKQAVSAKKLQEIITAARKEMPELLSWTKVGVNELIRRVELRSSLVMQSGHLAEGHRILPSYEFRHLTFQEYLAACAIVHGHLPRGTDADLVAVLRPYLDNVEWKEVVPLAAVMAGRKSQALLQELIERTSRHLKEQPRPRGRIVREKKTRPGEVLASCLVDEVQATPELVQAATTLLIHDSIFPIQLAGIREGKYGPMLLEAARTEFLRSKDDLLSIAGNMGVAYGWPHESTAFTKATSDRILSSCNDSDPIKQALACLNLMTITFTKHTQLTAPRKNPSKAAPTLSKRENLLVESWRGCLLGPRTSPHDGVKLAALWAEVWMVHLSRKPPAHASELAPDLISLWQSSDCIDLKYIASWLLASMPLIDRETIHLGSLTELDAFLKAKWFEPTLRFERAAAFAIAYYLRSPWDDQELANMLEDKANYETQGLSEYFDAFKKSFHAATR